MNKLYHLIPRNGVNALRISVEYAKGYGYVIASRLCKHENWDGRSIVMCQLGMAPTVNYVVCCKRRSKLHEQEAQECLQNSCLHYAEDFCKYYGFILDGTDAEDCYC